VFKSLTWRSSWQREKEREETESPETVAKLRIGNPVGVTKDFGVETLTLLWIKLLRTKEGAGAFFF